LFSNIVNPNWGDTSSLRSSPRNARSSNSSYRTSRLLYSMDGRDVRRAADVR